MEKLDQATLKYGGVELNLTKSPDQAAVQFTPGRRAAGDPFATSSRSAGAPQGDLQDFEVFRSVENIDEQLDALRQQADVSVGTHVWHVDGEDDTPFIPTGKLYIEFKPGTDDAVQQDVLDELHLGIVEVVNADAYRVTVTDRSPNPIKCAIALQQRDDIDVAEPEFLTKPTTNDFDAPSGRFIATQWHHENTGGAIPIIDLPNAVFGPSHFRRGADAKIKEAWQFLQSMGSKWLKIAVIDTGFATDHPQLRGDGTKIRTAFNAARRTADVGPWFQLPDGSWGAQSHGTSCAAVACGAWDNTGVLGAAPNARLIPIKLDVLTDDAIKNAFEHALINGADIISCSLGFPKPVPLSTYVSNYITRVAREGRGGKGVPMFFAAGNANPASNNEPRAISDFAAHPSAICITASNSLDQRSDYSFYGPNAHNCAPTNGGQGVGITTATCEATDNGRLSLGYTSRFGGTSSAAPLAAGICALMLTANPNLTVADIRSILRQTSDKIGSAAAYNANGHSPYYGYGRLNALRAVQMAARLAGSGAATTTTPVTPPATKPPASTPVPPPPVVNPAVNAGLKGRVLSSFLNVRSGPATTYPKVRELHAGDVVNLLERLSGWWRISATEYVSADYIGVISATRQGKVIAATLNVRSGPSVGSAKVGQLSIGNIVNVLETSRDGWHRIGNGRWVLGKYIQLV
jgi:uncharacterized protein YraI